LAGVDRSYISRIEREDYKLTSPETIHQIARALKVRPRILIDALFGENNNTVESPKSIKDLTIEELLTELVEIPILKSLDKPNEFKEEKCIMLLPKGSKADNLAGIRVKEDDCGGAGGRLLKGDVIIIDKGKLPEIGKKIIYKAKGTADYLVKLCESVDQFANYEVFGVCVYLYRKL
jgi:transcriptional regulator with XRE-family HTH domain